MKEFPYKCKIYTMVEASDSTSFDPKFEEKILYVGKCDIQMPKSGNSITNKTSDYVVYYPSKIPVSRDMLFEGNYSGKKIQGEVIDCSASQFDKCVLYIREVEI